MIRAILAHDSQYGIGKDGDLPWPKISEDLKWFKESTSGSTVVMGRNTWNSLPFKPLPNRHNVVVSRNTNLKSDIIEVLRPDIYKSRMNVMSQHEDVWIIGGAQLLESSLDIIDELWLNNVGGEYDCDVFLPYRKIESIFKVDKMEIRTFGVVSKLIKRTIK
jgi:dihydrofolate reductase